LPPKGGLLIFTRTDAAPECSDPGSRALSVKVYGCPGVRMSGKITMFLASLPNRVTAVDERFSMGGSTDHVYSSDGKSD